MLGKERQGPGGSEGLGQGIMGRGHVVSGDLLGMRAGCRAGRRAGWEPGEGGGGQIRKAFVIDEKSLRDSFHGQRTQSRCIVRRSP